MRERLGLPHALLRDPEILILDEPANGPDPEGHAPDAATAARLRRPGRDRAALDAALQRADLALLPVEGDRRLVDARPEQVARAAMADDDVLRRTAPALTTTGANTPSPSTDVTHREPTAPTT